MPSNNPNCMKNLVQTYMTPDELRTHASLMGKRSGEIRKKKKYMRTLALELLNAGLQTEDEFRVELAKRGIEQTEAAAILLAQLRRARGGDTDAARFLRDTSGQKPVDNVAIGNMDDLPFETLDFTKLNDDQLKTLVNRVPQSHISSDPIALLGPGDV